MLRTTMIVAAAALLATPALAQNDGPTLTVGDEAPKIDIAHWLKGQEVGEFEDDRIYVIEFWATWCGPCIRAFPHLSHMQEKFADYGVQFVGISDEPLQKVFAFMFREYSDGKIQNERMKYTVTTDPDRSVYNDYFKAAGRTGIPSALVVGKDQRIEWIGHPAAGLEEALDQIVRDEWDRDAFRVGYEQEQAAKRAAQKTQLAIRDARRAQDWPRVVELYDELMATSSSSRLRIDTFVVIATKLGDYDKAYAFLGDEVEKAWDDAMALNSYAWYIVDLPQLERRDTDLALKAANRSNELEGGTNAAVLDTVAKVHFVKGHIEKAIEYQRQAVEHADESMKADLQKRLDEYQAQIGK